MLTSDQDLVDHSIHRNIIINQTLADGQSTDNSFGRSHQKSLRSIFGNGPARNWLLPSSGDHRWTNDATRELFGQFGDLMLCQVLCECVCVGMIFQETEIKVLLVTNRFNYFRNLTLVSTPQELCRLKSELIQ